MEQITDAASDIITDKAVYKIASDGKSNTAKFQLPDELDYDSIEWYVNGELALSGELLFPVNAEDFNVGTRSVTVRVIIDGNVYNKTVYFTVFMY